MLYWFRTPAGVRVGRAPLDEDAIRLIEEHHPHIRFDWPQILKGEEEPAPPEPPDGENLPGILRTDPGSASRPGLHRCHPLPPKIR